MKLINYFIAVNSLIFFSTACNKSGSGGLASLKVINANSNAPSVLVYLTDSPDSFYQNQAPVYYGSYLEYGTPSGATPLSIYDQTDTIKPLFSANLNLKPGGIYSLYLAGIAPQIDTLITQDIIPFHPDSAVSTRFINLSPGSQPITVNLQGNAPTQLEFPALGYKTVSDFKNYPATADITAYTFEIRDQASGNLLTTFTWNFLPFKSNTLVISGSEDPSSTTPINIIQVNNF